MPRDWAGQFVQAIGIAQALAVVLVPLRSTSPPFTLASMSASAAAADLIAGIGLVAAGVVSIRLRRTSVVGPLAVVASIAWFVPDWIGWAGGPAFARSLGMVLTPFLAPVVLHLVVAGTIGLRGDATRRAVIVAYLSSAVLTAGRALVRDPFLDLDCFAPPRNCEVNAFLVWPNQGLAGALDVALSGLTIVLGIGLAAFAARSIVAASGPARTVRWPLLASGILVGAVEGMYAAVVLVEHRETAYDFSLQALFFARVAGMVGLSVAVISTSLRASRVAASVTRLGADISAASTSGTLQASLSRSLHDPDLRVAYPRPETTTFVDSFGAPVAIAPLGPGQVATPITRGGKVIALVVHDAGLVDPDELGRQIGSAARLAVDNERLNAEVAAQLRALLASRSRIVETGDLARRRVERDLHDGAQQRLLAISYELRLARAAAQREGDEALLTLVERSIADTAAALDELRELAHGIFPAVLSEAGLGPALADLADRSTIPLDLHGDLAGRCPAATETAAYVVIDESVRSAASRGASHVRIDVERRNGTLNARITDDGVRPAGPLTHLVDRAGAAGGRLVDMTDGPGLVLRLEIPCASS